ncbi:MAG TPA: hypothetical protein PKY82_31620 [Pyrinomonadaceae bacterium]|nr:hypothetical protein [Pyrinomonadaceae bacterium]
MNLIGQKKNIQNWIAQNYGAIIIILFSLLSQLTLSYIETWIPFQVAFPIWSLLIANALFIFLLVQKKFNEENSKLIIWLKINLTAIIFSFVIIGFSFLFVYGVSLIPDSILPVLWIGAFITVVSILLFRLNRLVKNRKI